MNRPNAFIEQFVYNNKANKRGELQGSYVFCKTWNFMVSP